MSKDVEGSNFEILTFNFLILHWKDCSLPRKWMTHDYDFFELTYTNSLVNATFGSSKKLC